MHRLENCRLQKCVIMGSSPLDLYARDYFNSLNSIAEKISTDITTTVAAYEDLWHTLSIKDQHQVINETIIHPEVVLKYSLCKSEDNRTAQQNPVCHSYCNDGGKGIGIIWSDEHSAPFSWKTRSQQDLNVFCEQSSVTGLHSSCRNSVQSVPSEKIIKSDYDIFIDPPNIVLGGSSSKLAFTSINTASTDSSNFLDKMKSKSVVLKIQSAKGALKTDRSILQSTSETGSAGTRINGGCKTSKTLPSRLISKPKNPPPPPPPKSKQLHLNSLAPSDKKITLEKQPLPSETKPSTSTGDILFIDSFNDFRLDINTSIKSDDLPKTGFDFLDNW